MKRPRFPAWTLASLLVVPLLAFPPKTDKPVPVDEEPLHKVELKNDQVTVLRLTLPPGKYYLAITTNCRPLSALRHDSNLNVAVLRYLRTANLRKRTEGSKRFLMSCRFSAMNGAAAEIEA